MATFQSLQDALAVRMAKWENGNELPLSYFGNELAGEVGEACNDIKKLERERYGMVGSRTTPEKLATELADGIICLYNIALRLDLDLDRVVRQKFNATSEKYGLNTKVMEI